MEKQFTDFGLLHYKKLTELSFYTDSKVEDNNINAIINLSNSYLPITFAPQVINLALVGFQTATGLNIAEALYLQRLSAYCPVMLPNPCFS
ncbi:hypothetical protein [Endozoicomonas sp. SCSIO W0465]|uniref:hypothetical protein n=1 Tax=Endozoicomonas sp. SCSIO W0465 TaxID=2918516 RepID=UPI0020764903|nr:hypothetical protein [Endozoicomonas sp. SCSIO W0465]USE36559.1 hypothetical protein MJO57_31885 [Endozoicomonas sp. SCSIO W0465]